MNIEKYKNKGISGLINLGNTCFLNSALQILSHTYELNEFLDLKTYKKHLNNKCDSILLIEWDNLRTLLWSQNCVITPNKFVMTVQKVAQIKKQALFTGYQQNDLPEFLCFLIDCFHNSLSREVNMTIDGLPQNNTDKIALKCFETIKQMYQKDYSELWEIFYGIHVSQLININTQKKTITPEPYFIISLPIPTNNKNPTLIDCFDLYVEGEMVEGIKDETTGELIEAKKSIMFWNFPNILVIDLKRFNSFNKKNQILVSFPLDDLNLSKYVIGYKKDTFVYELYGVCNHFGSSLGGHYTAFIKNANGKWYHFNDNIVSEVKKDEDIITPKAYCFFYRKKQL